jgi:hypothetical protein
MLHSRLQIRRTKPVFGPVEWTAITRQGVRDRLATSRDHPSILIWARKKRGRGRERREGAAVKDTGTPEIVELAGGSNVINVEGQMREPVRGQIAQRPNSRRK